ncbi:hypothetical protein BT69DRAFT_1111843 [Atractiella rhizophila]|nr:hypothetical protein BT69DRAFT_1111843 [Atractiella rhizophila]
MGDTECSSWLWCWEVGTYVSVIALSLMGINMAYAWWNAGDHYRLLNRHLRSPTNRRLIPGSLSARSPTASPEPEHQLMTEYPKPLPPNPALYRKLRARQAAGKSLGSGTKDDPVLVPFSLGVGPSGRIESLEEYISNRRWEEDGRGVKDRGPRFTKLGESKGGKGQTQEEHVRYPRREREREEREGKGGKKRKGTKRKNESDTDLEEVDRRPSKKRTQEEEAASAAKSSRTSTTLKKTRRKRSPASSRSPSPTSSVSSRPTKKKSRRDDPSDSASSSEYSAMDVSEDEPAANLKRKERLDRSPSLEGSETAPLDGRSQFDPNLSDTKRRRKRRKSNASVSEREEREEEGEGV